MSAMVAFVAAHQFLLIGVIVMLVIGPAVGNYACSVVYRLPRGQTPFERHPFCGYCNTDLKPIDLFPIISWCLTRGKCRYCAAEIPALYTLIEVACGAIFVTYFLRYGISEPFLLYAAYGVFVTVLAAIQWQQGWISSSIFAYALTAVALVRTLGEHTIYGWFDGFMLALVLSVAVHMLNAKLRGTRFDPFTTPWIWWLALMGALVPQPMWALLLVPVIFLLLFNFMPRDCQKLVLIPIASCAIFLPVVLHG